LGYFFPLNFYPRPPRGMSRQEFPSARELYAKLTKISWNFEAGIYFLNLELDK
jgi:hypothetical protein